MFDPTETICSCGHGRRDHLIGDDWIGPECLVDECPCSFFESAREEK